ncbi:MAG: phospho-sugar mutase [Clostridia bacterium]|nr:phospho-sugar mutase [Clostridia bacterium]
MDYKTNFDLWKENVKDTELLTELNSLTEEEREESFYKNLEFGTGGLRGVIGVGTNRMNIYTVMKASQGYANYLRNNNKKSVGIAYDSRNKSTLFAKKAAEVFAANGIKVYIYKELMPTPMLSFAVRELSLDGGIVITASHNPAKYNGYKVYGEDGCQITDTVANGILNEIEKIDIFSSIKNIDFEKAKEEGKIEYISDDMLEVYMNYAFCRTLHKSYVPKELKIVYTPLNGTGLKPVTKILAKAGYKNILIPKEQEMPDGNFTTCKKPNPEEEAALTLAINLAKENDFDVVLATDPDCDRVGVAVKDGTKYKLISGNEMGVLLLNYICETTKLPNNPIAIKTIVTTDMAEKIAKNYGIEIINVLTGFKYIGEQIGYLEEKHELDRYIFGFEESYGYLTHTKARDKDAIDTSLTICEMINYYKVQGKSLVKVLNELYEKYGYFNQKLKSFEFTGVDGSDKMNKVVDTLRANPLNTIVGDNLIVKEDYKVSEKDYVDGKVEKITLPKSNVIKLIFENDVSVTVRPSGTEPKLKLYYSVKGQDESNAESLMNGVISGFEKYLGL